MLYALDLDSLPLPEARRIGITDLPIGLLTNKILPFCEARDMIRTKNLLAQPSESMNDDAFWRRRLAVDYNFTGSETNRTSGWKFIYLRLGKARLFAWGCVLFILFFTRPFTHLSIYWHTCLIVTIQNDSPTRALGFSEGDPSGHLAATRNSPGEWTVCQPGSERLVSASRILIQQNDSHPLSFL